MKNLKLTQALLDQNRYYIMKKNLLGKTGIEVTEVGFGVLPVGPHQQNLSPEEGGAVLAYALKRGINFIDTAQYYYTYPHIRYALDSFYKNPAAAAAAGDGRDAAASGAVRGAVSGAKASHVLSAAAASERPVICSKSLVSTYKGMEEAVIEAIEAFGYCDIFLLHEVRSGDFETRQGAWEFLKDAKAEGLIRAIGISTHHVDVVRELSDIEECDVIFPLINYQALGVRNGDGPGTREDMEAAIRQASSNGKGIFTMKTFGGGPLVSDYNKCLDYNRGIEGSASTMIGLASKSDVDDLFDYLDGKYIRPDVSKKIMHIEKGSCEGCGACIRRCASGAISFSKEDGLAEIDHSKCMTCGYCVGACPVRAIILY